MLATIALGAAQVGFLLLLSFILIPLFQPSFFCHLCSLHGVLQVEP